MDDFSPDLTQIKGCPYKPETPEGILWLNRARAMRDAEDHKKKAANALAMSDRHMDLHRKSMAEVKAFDRALNCVLSQAPHSAVSKAQEPKARKRG